jgi:hypothetical protein
MPYPSFATVTATTIAGDAMIAAMDELGRKLKGTRS